MSDLEKWIRKIRSEVGLCRDGCGRRCKPDRVRCRMCLALAAQRYRLNRERYMANRTVRP